MWTLVTGGAKGLGAALSLYLAEQGFSLAVHYNHSSQEALEVVAKCKQWGGRAEAIQGDFSSLEGVQDFLSRYQKQFIETAVLINNVGDYLTGSALQTPIDKWISLFQVNLHTPFLLSQVLAPSLIKNKGHIINIGASGLKRNSASTYSTAYTMTKESLWKLTLSLARELAPQGVRVNMVSPGELERSVSRHPIPMKRPAACREVCRVVNFLLDPASEYLTGQNIEVAGGLGLV